MQKKEVIAELNESISQYGNKYFYGFTESGLKVRLNKLKGRCNQKGEPVWELIFED